MNFLKTAAMIALLGLAPPAAGGPLTDLAQEAETRLAQGDAVGALELMDEAAALIIKDMPLSLKVALFADQATGYGIYIPRPSPATFSKDDRMLVYIEPLGYGFGQDALGNKALDFAIDLELRSSDGVTRVERDDFARIVSPVRYDNREFFLNVTVNLTGVPAGAYTLVLTVRDESAGKSAETELPFTWTN